MLIKQLANRMRRELETGKTLKGQPLDDAMRQERLAQLRRRAATLPPRYRCAEESKLAELEKAVTAHVTAEANRVVSEVSAAMSSAMAPLIARSEGRVPPRRPGQTAAERKLELDQVLPRLRAEHKQCAEELAKEKKEKKEEKAGQLAKERAERAERAEQAERAERPAKRQRSSAPAASPPVELTAEDLAACYHTGFVTGELHEQLCQYLGSLEPLEVQYRGHPVKTRPKRNWSLQRPSDGAFSLYKWGQEVADYALIEPMPELVQRLAQRLEDHFGHERGFLNNAMATVYETGKEQYIPLHQDKAHSREATGKVEDKAPIYNVSLLATRTFVLAGAGHAGKVKREDFAEGIVKEWPMASGDLVVLPPQVNARLVHGVPCEPEVAEKRVSLVFRHVTKHLVRQVGDVWEACDVRPGGHSSWKALPKQPTDTVEQRVEKRRRQR